MLLKMHQAKTNIRIILNYPISRRNCKAGIKGIAMHMILINSSDKCHKKFIYQNEIFKKLRWNNETIIKGFEGFENNLICFHVYSSLI